MTLFILSWNLLIEVYEGLEEIVDIFDMSAVAVVKVTAMLCGDIVVIVGGRNVSMRT